MRSIFAIGVSVRILAWAILMFAPSLDQPSELAGWDVARFQEIEDGTGQPYVDFEIEYPPGTVVLVSLITALDDGPNRLVTSHRVLASASLLVDLGLALTLYRAWKPTASAAYLIISTPLMVLGLGRFDLWAALLAVGAAAAIKDRIGSAGSGRSLRSTTPELEPRNRWSNVTPGLMSEVLAAAAIVTGSLIKLWPAFLIAAAAFLGRYRLAALGTIGGILSGVIWIAVSGTDAINQVATLRDAVGWQIETVGGSITALLTDQVSELQANAYRIGTINDWLVAAGRVLTVGTAIGLGWLGQRSMSSSTQNHELQNHELQNHELQNHGDNSTTLALIMLGSTSALVVTAPLLSPQFLLWLTPWAAMLCNGKPKWGNAADRALLLTGLAVAMTSLILAIAGTANLHQTAPALALLLRDAVLVAIAGTCAVALKDGATRPTETLVADQPNPPMGD